MDICQIDSCRVAGVNEILSILLIAAKYKVPVCPHAGGVGLCEYVQHLAMFDYLCVSGRQNIIEYVNHLHEHFRYPCQMRNACYMPPMDAGYSIEMFPQSIANFTFPTGPEWVSRVKARQAKAAAAASATGHPAAALPASATSAVAAAAATGSASAGTGDVWLITGAQGFVGGWVIKALLQRYGASVRVVAHDVRHDDHILAQILTPQELASITRVYCDISHTQPVLDLVTAHAPKHVIHLAGLQIPTCRANPPLGAAVNVLGTINVFEAAVRLKATHPVTNVIYASSAAMYGPAGDYGEGAVPEGGEHRPRTMYGVFKQTNEGCARIYWQDHGVCSVGLRMMTVYGVGREVGMTSGPTKAIKSAVLGREMYEVAFKGKTSFNDVRDVARLFIEAALKAKEGAVACGVKGVEVTVEEFMSTAERVVPELKGRYKFASNAGELPFPSKSAHTHTGRALLRWAFGSVGGMMPTLCGRVLCVRCAGSTRRTWRSCWEGRCPCRHWRRAFR